MVWGMPGAVARAGLPALLAPPEALAERIAATRGREGHGMTPDSFDFLAGLVKQRSGIVLTADKGYMLETRLAPMLRRDGIAGARRAGAARCARRGATPLAAEVVEALTTNESSFFRDGKPFEHLKKLLPQLAAARPPGSRSAIWSAACSTGQEAYSHRHDRRRSSAPALAGGGSRSSAPTSRARCSTARRRASSPSSRCSAACRCSMLVKHFRAGRRALARRRRNCAPWCASSASTCWTTCARSAASTSIFCRNVLIYFDAPTKSRVLAALAGQLPPDGVLYLGGAETVLGLTDRLVPAPGERGVYEPARPAARSA